MTDLTHKQALTDLLAMVEAGDDAGFRKANRTVFSTPRQDMALQLREEYCRHAYNGSLDAAKSLHEAVLPDWDHGHDGSIAWVKQKDKRTSYRHDAQNGFTARAWLIAIIKALIAESPE